VLWEAVSQTKYCCSPKTKTFAPSKFWAGYAAVWDTASRSTKQQGMLEICGGWPLWHCPGYVNSSKLCIINGIVKYSRDRTLPSTYGWNFTDKFGLKELPKPAVNNSFYLRSNRLTKVLYHYSLLNYRRRSHTDQGKIGASKVQTEISSTKIFLFVQCAQILSGIFKRFAPGITSYLLQQFKPAL